MILVKADRGDKWAAFTPIRSPLTYPFSRSYLFLIRASGSTAYSLLEHKIKIPHHSLAGREGKALGFEDSATLEAAYTSDPAAVFVTKDLSFNKGATRLILCHWEDCLSRTFVTGKALFLSTKKSKTRCFGCCFCELPNRIESDHVINNAPFSFLTEGAVLF